MKAQDYTTTFAVDESSKEVFDAINNPRCWWSEEIEGDTDKLNAEFRRHYRDAHRSTFRITEFVPAKKVVWHVLDNYFNSSRTKQSGQVPTLFSRLRRRATKRKCASRTSASCPLTNATTFARTLGAATSAAAGA